MSTRVDVIAIAHDQDLRAELGFTSFCPLHIVRNVALNHMRRHMSASYDLTYLRDGVVFKEETVNDEEYFFYTCDADDETLETA